MKCLLGQTKADDRRAKKSADFCTTHDRQNRPILSAINSAVELDSNFAEKIGRFCRSSVIILRQP